MKNKVFRFLVGSLGLITLLLIGTALIAPHFIQVDKYRPELVKAINDKIKGSFSLGNLKLDLWGKVAVSAEEADLKDPEGKTIVSVGRFFFKVPLISLLKLSPEVRLELDSPQIFLERSKKGEWNVLDLMKKTETFPAESSSPSASKKVSQAPLALLAKTKLSMKVESATLEVKDNQTQNQFTLSSLFLRTGELSLENVPEFEAGAQVKTQTPAASVEGPLFISGKSKGSDLELEINLNQLKIEKEGVFIKKAGVAADAQMILSRLSDALEIKKGVLQFHESSAQFEGQVRSEGSSVFQISSGGVELKSFETLLPALPKEAIQGKVNFNLELKGPPDQLQAQLKSGIENFSFKAKAYPKPLRFSGELSGKMNFQKNLEGDFVFLSSSVDAAGIEIKPVRIQARQVGMKINSTMNEADTLGGKLKATFSLDMSGKVPRYRFSKTLKGISLESAIASQMDIFKNTLVGNLDGVLEGEGEGFDPEMAKKKLKAQGKVEVRPARFSTIDINKVISEVSREMTQKLQDQVPQLKGKTLKLDPVASEFKKMTASFKISDGEFVSTDFFAESFPQKGVDIRGSTRVGILDYRLQADWEITDPYNVTRAKDLNVDLAGVRLDSILVEKGKAFRFPIKVRGTLFEPKYDYGSVPEALAQVALKNISGAAQEKMKGEAKKKAQEELQKLTEKAPAPVKNLLKGLFK